MQKKPLNHNWAEDREFAEALTTELTGLWNTLKTNRKGREDIWMEGYRIWTVDRTEADKNYKGMANICLPQARKEIETMARRLTKASFPEDYLRAEAVRFEDDDLAVCNTQVVRHYLDNVTNLRLRAAPWIKQGVIYGTSPLRSFWKKEVNELYFRQRYHVDVGGGVLEPKFKKVSKKITIFEGPVSRAEDLFQTVVYPSNAAAVDDIKKVFWRTKVTLQDLKQKEKDGAGYDIARFENEEAGVDTAFQESQERMAQFGESAAIDLPKAERLFDLLEVWTDVELPDGSGFVPCVVEIVNEKHCIRVQRNPYWHQRPPFDFMRYIIPPPGEFYGRGLPEAIFKVQAQLDDTLNQTMDSATLALNNITIINPAYAPNHESFEIEPGAKWYAAPEAVKQMTFPDLSDTGLKNATVLRGIITEMSDNSPQLPDPIAGKARSTGQAQLAMAEWQTDLFEIANQLATEGLAPHARKVHMLIQQNVEDDSIIRISGKYAGQWVNRVVTPDMLCGFYLFKWLPALELEAKSIKTQQVLNFVKIAPSLPPEVQARIQWDNIIIKLFRDSFMIRDVENVYETERLTMSTPALIENKILKLGGEIQVHPSDDDVVHEKFHRIEEEKEQDLYIRSKLAKHRMDHEQQREKKKMALAIQAKAMIAPPQIPQGQGSKPEGNPTQIPESTNRADLEKGMRA